MELQARRNSPQSEDKVQRSTTSLTQALPRIKEFLTGSALSTTGVLKDRCDVCSQNLRACIVAIEHAVTNSSTLEKVKLRDLQTRLQEHEIRFETWKADCNVMKGWLSVINRDQEGSLYQSIDGLFTRMYESLKSLSDEIDHLQSSTIEASGSSADDEKAQFDRFDQAAERGRTACDTMTQTLHELAELQPNIQMAQAVYRDQGPYADMREAVEQISEKYLNDGTEDDEDIKSDATSEKGDEPNSGDQRCPRCKRSVPYHALAYHTNTCSEPVPSSDILISKGKGIASSHGKDVSQSETEEESFTRVNYPSSKLGKSDHDVEAEGNDVEIRNDGVENEIDDIDVSGYLNQITKRFRSDFINAGVHYTQLAEYLSGEWTMSQTEKKISKFWGDGDDGDLCGTIHIYNPYMDKYIRKKNLVSPKRVLLELRRAQGEGGSTCFVFLCGNPRPRTLAGLAQACHLHPEFLRRHLPRSSTLSDTTASYFWSDGTNVPADLTLPSLPSASLNIIQLQYTSIGRLISRGKQRSTEPPGKNRSIVRDTFLCGNNYVCIEQQISMCVEYLPGGSNHGRDSWFAFVWIDSGNETSTLLLSGHETKINFIPISMLWRESVSEILEDESPFRESIFLNIHALHTGYGKDLDPAVMNTDAFYAFHSIFEFCAFSEVQFLNLMEERIKEYWIKDYAEYCEKPPSRGNPSLKSLEIMRTRIVKHMSQIQMTLRVIRIRGDSRWPRTTDRVDVEIAIKAANQLESDFDYLLFRARNVRDSISDLISHCRACQAANAHTDYTPLAIALIYMTLLIFTTSFFSMNFKGLENLSVWVYFVLATGLIIALTTALWLWPKLHDSLGPFSWKAPQKKPIESMDSESEKTEKRATPTHFPKSWLHRRRTTLPV